MAEMEAELQKYLAEHVSPVTTPRRTKIPKKKRKEIFSVQPPDASQASPALPNTNNTHPDDAHQGVENLLKDIVVKLCLNKPDDTLAFVKTYIEDLQVPITSHHTRLPIPPYPRSP